eukprot:4772819-Heterocapsa_arctica.AAC.1
MGRPGVGAGVPVSCSLMCGAGPGMGVGASCLCLPSGLTLFFWGSRSVLALREPAMHMWASSPLEQVIVGELRVRGTFVH